MIYKFVVFMVGFIACLLTTTLVWSAPVPKGKLDSSQFFPIAVGSKWVYEKDGKDYTEEITESELKDGDIYMTVVYQLNKQPKGTILAVLSPNAFSHQKKDTFGQPVRTQLVKIPLKAGDKWKTFTGAWPLGESQFVTGKQEAVEVAFGKFMAWKIDTSYPQKMGGDIIATWWYAPEVGLIKYTRGDEVQVLKSFTMGKASP